MNPIRALKKKLILFFLENKKKKEPYNEQEAEVWQLPADADININNSHFFTAADASGMNLSVRLGMRNGCEREVFILFRQGGRFLIHEKDSFAESECPVRFTLLECGRRWRIDFEGRLKVQSSGELLDSSFSVEFEATRPIFDFMYHSKPFTGMAESIAREKWTSDFFKAISGNNQRHYEQTGRLRGKLVCGTETFAIDMPCVRDHSFGRREWDMMNDHLWCLGLTAKGEALCFSIVNYPAMKRIYSGYTDVDSEYNLSLTGCSVTGYDRCDGAGGDVLEFECTFFGGRKVPVRICRTDNVTCPLGGGKFNFQEGLGEFEIGGVKARGTIEYGFNADRSRWEGFSEL